MCLVHVKLSTHSTAPSPRRHSNATGPQPPRQSGGPPLLCHTWALPAAPGVVWLSALGTSGRGPPLTGKLEVEHRVCSRPVVTAWPRQHDGSPWSGTREAWVAPQQGESFPSWPSGQARVHGREVSTRMNTRMKKLLLQQEALSVTSTLVRVHRGHPALSLARPPLRGHFHPPHSSRPPGSCGVLPTWVWAPVATYPSRARMKVSGSTGTAETDPRGQGHQVTALGPQRTKCWWANCWHHTVTCQCQGPCRLPGTAQLESTSQFCLLVLSKWPIPACLKPLGSEASGYIISKCTHVGDMSSGTKARPWWRPRHLGRSLCAGGWRELRLARCFLCARPEDRPSPHPLPSRKTRPWSK